MPYDGLFTGAVARRLSEELPGAKIERVQQPDTDEIILQVHLKSGERRKLLISANPQAARVQYTELPYENPEAAPGFCMLLRKHLQGGRISSVRQIETERIIHICVDTVNELGFSSEKILIAELMGKHSNIVLIDSESSRIIDSVKRISIDVNRYRQILPGLIYTAPPSQGKLDTLGASEEQLREALAETDGLVSAYTCASDAASRSDIHGKLVKLVSSKLQGFGSSIAEELCAGIPDAGPLERLLSIRADIEAGRLSPAVYLDANGVPKDVHVIPMTIYSGSLEKLEFGSICSALDYYYSHRAESNKRLQRARDLDKLIGSLEEKQLHKKAKLLDELKAAEGADVYRLKGELLNANLHLAKPGDRSIKVISYYDGTEMTIELDERFSAAKNAQNYYKRYAKAKTALREKHSQLAECEEAIAYLSSLHGLTAGAATGEEIDLIRSELASQGYIRLRKQSQRNKKQGPKPRSFKLKSGKTLLVGRSNTENDHITFRMGTRSDYWFHTKDIPGSHAVLLTGGEEPSEADIYEAAGIAAWFSQAQSSGNVPVDYVPLKYVKKPSGAKPGMVIFTNNRTVWVDPLEPGKQL